MFNLLLTLFYAIYKELPFYQINHITHCNDISHCRYKRQILLFLSFLLSKIILSVKYAHFLRDSFQDSEGMFLLPEAVEVDSMRHMVVYDSNTSCLQEQGHWILHHSTQ